MKIINLLLLLPLAIVLSSCGASVGLGGTGATSDSLASVSVNSTDLAKAKRVTRQVFSEEGFRETGTSSNTILFTKVGGRSARLAWGGWYDEVMINPEVLVMPGASGIRIDCDLYITNYSEAFGESSARKPWRAGRSAYRSVLKRIKKQIESQ